TGADHIDTAVDKIAATSAGGIYLTDTDALTIGTVADVQIQRVDAAGVAAEYPASADLDANLIGLTTSADGTIVQVAGGTLTVDDSASNQVSANGSGNVRIETTVGDVVLDNPVKSGEGHVTVIAADTVRQNINGDIETGDIGTIDVQAVAGAIEMADGTHGQTAGGSIRYVAETYIELGLLNAVDAVSGNVYVAATDGSVTDANAGDENILAIDARLTAGTFIGTGANHIDTAVNKIAAMSAGGIYLTDTDALTIGTVADVRIQRVDAAGVAALYPAVAAAGLVGLMTSAGGTIVQIAGGELTVSDPVSADGSGNVRLETTAGEDIWKDDDLDGLYDSGEEVYVGGDGLQVSDGFEDGIQTGLYYYDADDSGDYTTGEDIWKDDDLDGLYDSGEDVYVGGDGLQVSDGFEDGIQTGLYYYDADGSNDYTYTAGDVVLDNPVTSGTGHVTVIATGTIKQNTNGNIETGGIGTIDVEAVAGEIEMADGTYAQTAGGNIRYASALDILIRMINAGSGKVSLISDTGSIYDDGDAAADIIADELRMRAGIRVGILDTPQNLLETSVETITAAAGSGGIGIIDSDAVTVGAVSVSVNRVNSDATITVVTDLEQTGLTTTDAGSILLQTKTQSVTIDGPVTADALKTSGGEDAVPALAIVDPLGDNNTILLTALSSGTAFNGATIKLVNDDTLTGNDAGVDYVAAETALKININNGVTTAQTVVDRINDGLDINGDVIPFSAANGAGSSGMGTIHTPSLVTVSDLPATAVVTPPGGNNDLIFTANTAGSTLNDVTIRFVDDGTITGNAATAGYNATDKLLTIKIKGGKTDANAVIDGVDAQGKFTASLYTLAETGNNGTGLIQSNVTYTYGGTASTTAKATVAPAGANNYFKLTATATGASLNDVTIIFVDNNTIADGTAVVSYDADNKILNINIQNGVTTAKTVIREINFGDNSLFIPFVADNAVGSAGTGAIAIFDETDTAGGVSSTAEATVSPLGDNNDFKLIAEDSNPEFSGVFIRFIDDGSVTGNAAAAVYDNSDPSNRILTININNGITDADAVITEINKPGNTIPFSAIHIVGSDGTGKIHTAPVISSEGADAIPATLTITPEGINNDILLTATSGGTATNGVAVILVDGDPTPGNATASYDAVNKLLTIKINSGTTDADAVIAAVDAEGTYDAALSDLAEPGNDGTGTITVFNVPVGAKYGSIQITAPQDVDVDGSMTSATGDIDLTANGGDVSIGAAVIASGGGEISVIADANVLFDTAGRSIAVIVSSGENNNIILTAKQEGTQYNDIIVSIEDDADLSDDDATASYDSGSGILTISINAGQTTAVTVVGAINAIVDINDMPFTATLDAVTDTANDGTGFVATGMFTTASENSGSLSSNGGVSVTATNNSIANIGSVALTTISTFGDGAVVVLFSGDKTTTPSSYDLVVASQGAFTLNGAGLALNNADLVVEAGDTITINAPVDPPVNVTLSGENNVLINDTITAAESITINAGTDGSGSVQLNAALSGGAVDITAANDIFQNAGGQVSATGAYPVAMNALMGSIVMDSLAGTTVINGDVNYTAALNVVMSLLTSTDGNIAVTAVAGSISEITAAEDANIATAGRLTLTAGNGIGSVGPDEDIEIDVAVLDALNIGPTGDIVILQVDGASDDILLNRVAQTDENGDGSIIVTTESGTIAVFSGDSSILAAGSGNIRLQAQGAGSDVILNGNVLANGGHITILAADGITQEAPLSDSVVLTLSGGIDGAYATALLN
ncbi:beta strand repeat-containing protein, partial [Thermodesulfobacteriota bacterium]